MTTNARAVLVALLCLCPQPLAAEANLAADSGGLSLNIAGDETLARAAHTSIPVIVTLPDGGEHPLLLTPSIEGSALELVRGRLMRADAKRVDAQHLRFELPVVAKSEGTAILRVEVMTYVCSPGCRRVSASGSRVLRIR